ncbi:MAG: phosphoenolpyruvate--protein phosphotransferase [Clostridiales Family XIII bacterium]|jgi:phosphotransferase system enzyme I (PtsI)|nr:phosphoenolpyruvate--protein phosphotransferase [Clostridiales Family XIII bacterium]
MFIIEGISVFQGIAIGPIHYFGKSVGGPEKYEIENIEEEIARYEVAKATAKEQLQGIYEKALTEVGEEHAFIFEIHQIMLDDPDYNDSIIENISTRKVNAEYAVTETENAFAELFSSMDDPYMQGRAADIHDISSRIVSILSPETSTSIKLNSPAILAAEDFAPSETVQLDKKNLLAFATVEGSVTSHTAILARTMGIPAIVKAGTALSPDLNGKEAILDGFTGTLYIEPDEDTITAMRVKKKAHEAHLKKLDELKGKENITKSGQKINIYANAGNLNDLESVIENDAGGIGLFRSEFLYMETTTYPTEEQQFDIYKKMAQTMGDKRTIIRTLDIGADKQAAYFDLAPEENPALGLRGIRICLTRPEVFKTQLRALFRASVYGNICIMFPMIISICEIEEIYSYIEEIKQELREEGKLFRDDVETGIMIETPASVLLAPEFAKLVDFFSIGTNDLTQYTLALDRQNNSLDKFYDPAHPSVLRAIKMSADAAHAEGKWIGICGELGANLDLTETFLEMGIDELSVSPASILPLRDKVRSI